MSIRFDSEARIFVLETAHTSYHMKVDALGHLLHLYYGKTIGTGDLMQLYPRTCLLYTSPSPRDRTRLTAPTGAFPRICSRRSIPAATWAISVSPA